MRDYNKVYGDISILHEQLPVTKTEQQEYGFITKWRLSSSNPINGVRHCYGSLIQKYTGNMISHPSNIPNSQHREKVWLYDFSIGYAKISGRTDKMSSAITVLTDFMANHVGLNVQA